MSLTKGAFARGAATLVVVALCALLASCAQEKRKGTLLIDPPPGWISVEVGKEGFKPHAASDEVIAKLVELDVGPSAVSWVKPVTGNQNMVWGNTYKRVGSDLIDYILTRGSSAVPPRRIAKGTLNINGHNWAYVESFDRDNANILTSVFSCPHHLRGEVMLLYWGSEDSRFRHDLNDTISALTQYCQ